MSFVNSTLFWNLYGIFTGTSASASVEGAVGEKRLLFTWKMPYNGEKYFNFNHIKQVKHSP